VPGLGTSTTIGLIPIVGLVIMSDAVVMVWTGEDVGAGASGLTKDRLSFMLKSRRMDHPGRKKE
jgi:hypothetical protein